VTGMFYEVYPDLTLQADEAVLTWFEIALHMEVKEHRPLTDPGSGEACLVLAGLADVLIRCAEPHVRRRPEPARPYYTVHPPAGDAPGRARMARTISLVSSDLQPYTRHQEPAVLTRLRKELSLLGIAPSSHGGGDERN
jgi:hypothetical protein